MNMEQSINFNFLYKIKYSIRINNFCVSVYVFILILDNIFFLLLKDKGNEFLLEFNFGGIWD